MRFPTRLSLAILCAAATVVTTPTPAPAGVFERAFVAGSGDGLLTYDDVNQREWLDVTVFAGQWEVAMSGTESGQHQVMILRSCSRNSPPAASMRISRLRPETMLLHLPNRVGLTPRHMILKRTT